ncbi:serine protease inhibitor dipetalogastin-like isoform X2 [Ostrinia furnacalis]|uniref:serine protease inhibitor dipetalogastin-like isoform X2 n=1 Tax=Ostrinia furnacalis TaxID=93504 RepID=UPI00103B13E2|nr:serine protease inhibitor dipetalogastin-like isoform X2 [Ostrinia furnacalis]
MDCKILFVAVLLLCAGAQASQTSGPSCACARIYQPLCGSDGQTYNNLCELQCRAEYNAKHGRAPLEVYKRGRCENYE